MYYAGTNFQPRPFVYRRCRSWNTRVMQFGPIIMLVTRLFYTLVFVNFIDVFKLVTSTATQNDIFQLQSQMQILISQSQADRNRMEMIVRDSLDKDTEIQQLRNEIRNLK